MSSIPIDNQDKSKWCYVGQLAEADFLASRGVAGWALAFNPAKEKDPYTHDYLGVCPVDIKTITTPWRKSLQLFGIPSERAISINEKDFTRYSRLYPNIIILCNVEFAGELYLLTLDRARKLIKQGKAKRHEYKDRKDDTKGNAKVSYVFDTSDLDRVSEKGDEE